MSWGPGRAGGPRMELDFTDPCSQISSVPRENLPSRFKFKEYCPLVFRNLRERFGIDDQDYQVLSLLLLGQGSHPGREIRIQTLLPAALLRL